MKVTEVRVGAAQAAVAVVAIPVEERVEIPVEGQAVFVAELQGPEAEPLEQEEGSLADEAPQDAGTTLARAFLAVRKAAYDQVKSTAEAGLPFERRYCSAREPSAGVYF